MGFLRAGIHAQPWKTFFKNILFFFSKNLFFATNIGVNQGRNWTSIFFVEKFIFFFGLACLLTFLNIFVRLFFIRMQILMHPFINILAFILKIILFIAVEFIS